MAGKFTGHAAMIPGVDTQKDYFGFPGGIIRPNTPSRPITVSDVERLAKAGVHVEMKDIVDHVTRDPPVEPTPQSKYQAWYMNHYSHYLDLLLARLESSTMAGNELGTFKRRFLLSVTRSGDEIYIFAQYVGGTTDGIHSDLTPPIVLTDPASLFPSDSLLTRLHLLEKTK